MDNIIKKIVLDLGRKQVELTPEQCKKLKAALDEMFGKEVVREVHHHDYWPYRWYWYWDRSPICDFPGTTTIVYGDSGNNNVSASYSNNTITLKVA